MKSQTIRNFKLAAFAGLAIMAGAAAVRADVITSNPGLPLVYPDGVYRTPAEVHTAFHGAGLAIVLNNIEHRPFLPSNTVAGMNEIENFNSQMIGLVSVNGSAFMSANAFGPVTTEVFGKVGNVTGTFSTEMLSMNLSGTSPFGPFMIRESPTLASLGQTTITALGGGQYRVSSFFDIFTELSIDGGNSWIPADGAAHVTLVPEPGTGALMALGGIGLAGFAWRRRRSISAQVQ